MFTTNTLRGNKQMVKTTTTQEVQPMLATSLYNTFQAGISNNIFSHKIALLDSIINNRLKSDRDAIAYIEKRDDVEGLQAGWNKLVKALPFTTTTL